MQCACLDNMRCNWAWLLSCAAFVKYYIAHIIDKANCMQTTVSTIVSNDTYSTFCNAIDEGSDIGEARNLADSIRTG